jgi:hypothetical protein
MSTLSLIPWFIFGFKHPDTKFLGLNQTKTSLFILFVFEISYWILLYINLNKPDPNIAGQGSFAWEYFMVYEKGIFPCFGLAEQINPNLGDKIDGNYQFIYLITALVIDYILLRLVSPRTTKVFRPKTA